MFFKIPSKHYPQKRISKTTNISLDINYIGSGCGAVGWAVASNPVIVKLYSLPTVLKRQKNENGAGKAHS